MTPIHYFWIGEAVSDMELLTFQSCVKSHHQPVVWSYGSITNIPSFVIQKDASEIMACEEFLHYRNDLHLPLANISDIFRYFLLQKIGGYYSDTDVVILRNLDIIREEEFFCSTFEYGYGECANGCLMKLAKNSAVSNYLKEECLSRLQEIEVIGQNDIHYCYLGPFVVQKCAKELSVKVLPFDLINPISWRWVKKLIAYRNPDTRFLLKNKLRRYLPSIESRGYHLTTNTVAIHLCNEMWKQEGLNKNERFHSSSLYEKLKKQMKMGS